MNPELFKQLRELIESLEEMGKDKALEVACGPGDVTE